MSVVWNEQKIIEAIKTCKSSSEVHKRFSGGWKWLRRNDRFDLLSYLNKAEAVSLQEIYKASPKEIDKAIPEATCPVNDVANEVANLEKIN